MDIVVRTPHGDAELDVVRHAPGSTIGELITTVTGQATPRVADLDGRVVDCATAIDDAGLVHGSVLSTAPPAPDVRRPDDVVLAQIAGPGAGRVRSLRTGRYRVGPGRRLGAEQLEMAPVDTAAFEVEVGADGAVSVGPAGDAAGYLALGGSPVHSMTPWHDEILVAGNRALLVDRRPPPDRRPLGPPDPDGTVVFSRPPRRRDQPARIPVVDAVREATGTLPVLWQRRPGDPDAYRIPIGVHNDAGGVATIELDLFADRVVALAGRLEQRNAVARAMIVEASTTHGPADLDLVIVSPPDRMAAWEWAKWLPHLCRDAHRSMFSDRADVATWADEMAERRILTSTPWPTGHITLLVVDGAEYWQRRESPLRQLVTLPPADLRIVVLCDDASQAPAACSVIVSESNDHLWRVLSLSTSTETDGVRAALIETDVAAEIARCLAPLADTDLPHTFARQATPDAAPLALADLLHISANGDAGAADGRNRSFVLGIDTDGPVRFDPLDDDVTVVASDLHDAIEIVATIALGAATVLGPPALWILDLLGSRATDGLGVLDNVVSPPAADLARINPTRLVERLRHLALDDARRPELIMVLVDGANTTMAAALESAAADLDHLVVVAAATDDLEGSRADDHRVIRVSTVNGQRRGSLDGRPLRMADAADQSALVVRPSVLHRALTSLEHRITRRSQPTHGGFVTQSRAIAERLAASAPGIALPSLVPEELPARIDAAALFDAHPGDGIPYGLLDVPATGATPMWWQPGDAALIAHGSPRSGVDDLFATTLIGLLDRFVVDDVTAVVVSRSQRLRQALEPIDMFDLVVAAERNDQLDALISRLDADPDGRSRVLLVDDLGHLRARAETAGLLGRLDAAMHTGWSLVAVASGTDDAGPHAVNAGTRLAASLSTPSAHEQVAVAEREQISRPRGRMLLVGSRSLVQLARFDEQLTTLVALRISDGFES